MSNSMIRGYPAGSNITIMNTIHFKIPETNPKTNITTNKEYLYVVYKDCDTREKKKEFFKDPEYRYYLLKPNLVKPYGQFFVDKNDCYEIYVQNSKLLKDIAERTGNLQFYLNNRSNGNYRENTRLHMHPAIVGSDMHIEDNIRKQFDDEYRNEPCYITSAYLDIEVDTKSIDYAFPEHGICPINAVSLMMKEENKVYSFLLKTKDNPLIDEFEQEVENGSIHQELRNFIIEAVGGEAKARYYNLSELNFQFLFYDEDREIDLISDIFKVINATKVDFLLAWNMAFDIPYIMDRILRLGYDPKEIMSHPDFPEKFARYFIDQRYDTEFKDLAERGDFATITSYTAFLDQMIHFASRRKGGEKFINYKLDYIGEKVARVRKLDYKSITPILGELPYKDYKTFVFYNIMDTIVQYCIEFEVEDLQYVFGKSLKNNTRYHKCHRQTVYLANRAAKEFYKQGYILGNNLNRFAVKPDKKFPGAFVADPLLLSDFSANRIHGIPIKVYNNLMDFDYASLYPSVIRQGNIAPNTLIGMLIIGQQIHNKENKCFDDKWSRAGAFMEDLQSQVWLEFCARWFNFPRFEQLYQDTIEYFSHIVRPVNYILRVTDLNGFITPMTFDDPNDKRAIQPMTFDDDYNHEENIVENMRAGWINGFSREKVEDKINELLANPNQAFRR